MAAKNTTSALNFVSNRVVNIPNTVTIVIQAWRLKPHNSSVSMIHQICLFNMWTKVRFFTEKCKQILLFLLNMGK